MTIEEVLKKADALARDFAAIPDDGEWETETGLTALELLRPLVDALQDAWFDIALTIDHVAGCCRCLQITHSRRIVDLMKRAKTREHLFADAIAQLKELDRKRDEE